MTMVRFKTSPGLSSINNLLDSSFPVFPSIYGKELSNKGFQPSVPVNVIQREKEFVLEIVAPGFEKEQLSINIEQDTLMVSAELKEVAEKQGEKEIKREYKVKAFKKSFTLPELADAENISAQYVNGILTLNLPLKTEVKTQAKQITIQ